MINAAKVVERKRVLMVIKGKLPRKSGLFVIGMNVPIPKAH
jgi:hypothetical protein